jgi:nucleotide-binding universal stress UspA family protein
MKLLANILLATDLSPSSEELIQNGVDLAKKFNAKITLIYVLKLNIKDVKIQQFLLSSAKETLQRIREGIIMNGVQCDTPIVAKGDFYDEIIKEAKVSDVNLILMGSSRKENKTTTLGNITKKVIQKTEIPVWVMKKGKSLDIEKILCPVDFSESSTRALKNAIIITKKFNAELIILNVYESEHPYDHWDVNYIGDLTYLKNTIEIEKVRNQKKFEKYLKKFKLKGINWRSILLNGFPSNKILNLIKNENIDLLIMGSTGKSGLSKFFMGSVTEKVCREVPCSFITTKKKNLIRVVIEAKLNDLGTHFREAKLLYKEGLYESAIQEYEHCLEIDAMHIRSYNGIADVYEKLGKNKKAAQYHKIAHELYESMWGNKIEQESRKYYSVKKDYQVHH